MRIAVGSDHAGFHLKTAIAEHIAAAGHEVVDCGPLTDDRVDYPDFGAAVGRTVRDAGADLGVCVCGSGIGMAMSANRHDGVRAARCTSVVDAELCRAHNDANVLCLGERISGLAVARRIVEAFFSTDFEGGRHHGRVEKITPSA